MAHDSDINLFVYFSYNLLFMRKRFTFLSQKDVVGVLGYITQSDIDCSDFH